MQSVMQDGSTRLAATMMYPRLWQRRRWVSKEPNLCNVVRRCDDDSVERART